MNYRNTDAVFRTERSLNDSCNPEHRRPGILAIVKRLQKENPTWSLERCTARAKTIWHQEASARPENQQKVDQGDES